MFLLARLAFPSSRPSPAESADRRPRAKSPGGPPRAFELAGTTRTPLPGRPPSPARSPHDFRPGTARPPPVAPGGVLSP